MMRGGYDIAESEGEEKERIYIALGASQWRMRMNEWEQNPMDGGISRRHH